MLTTESGRAAFARVTAEVGVTDIEIVAYHRRNSGRFVARRTDVDQIATAITEILADRDRAARMGKAGRRWAVDNWQWRYQAARLGVLLSG